MKTEKSAKTVLRRNNKMEIKEIRWIQRFSNYVKAMLQLKEAVELSKARELSKLEQQGVIQSFEYTNELAWKTLKDFLEYQGNVEIYGSRDAIRASFKLGLIENGELWMDMIKSRNKTSHTYDEAIANEIVKEIINRYYSEFVKLYNKLNKIKEKEETQL